MFLYLKKHASEEALIFLPKLFFWQMAISFVSEEVLKLRVNSEPNDAIIIRMALLLSYAVNLNVMSLLFAKPHNGGLPFGSNDNDEYD